MGHGSILMQFLNLEVTSALFAGDRGNFSRWSSCFALGLLCAFLFVGCATTLTQVERDTMIQQYEAWQSRIDFYAPIAQAAYRDSTTPVPEGYDRTIIEDIRNAPVGASTAYVFGTDETARVHVIGIEGTRDWNDVRIDMKALPREDRVLTISVHPGFAAIAAAVYQDLETRQRLKQGYAVGLTGHSLGGAAALLLAMYLQKEDRAIKEVVTFGQPMVTDKAGIIAFNTLLDKTIRVVACDDVIPFLPPVGYAQGGSHLLLLDPPHFEFAREDLTHRPFAVALLDDLKSLRENGTFYGHHMANYVARLMKPRTVPWVYTARDPRYCSGR